MANGVYCAASVSGIYGFDVMSGKQLWKGTTARFEALGHIRCQSGGVVEHPSAQQIKAGAAVHLALEHLDPVYVALDLSLAEG